ncbi:DUF2997 domain-containing protein [Paenibacillus sp. 276b]|uniref:DUF2997 domain-containing protein n=1 Tax=Paenibacillus sp. 276b TaxID=1566277 RepID=UPI000B8380D9|nr:DUF2997 domain-containing protein [Paenibacillus sp. 276b]
MKEVIMLFKADGTVIVEAVGYNGDGCEAATEPYEKGLGHVEERSYKKEYHGKNTRNQAMIKNK